MTTIERPAAGVGADCLSCGSGPLLPGGRFRPPGTPRRLTHEGRGLCSTCRAHHDRAETLAQFPRLTAATEDLAERAERLRRERHGWTWAEIAAELGVRPQALERARSRHRVASRDRGLA